MPDHANPGTVNPADQSYPSVGTNNLPQEPSSSALTTSTGENFFPGVTASPADQCEVHGLPIEVHAGSVSHVRAMPPTQAVGTPPAKDVNASGSRPGGLPINVYIR
jgi:hypothetical protein